MNSVRRRGAQPGGGGGNDSNGGGGGGGGGGGSAEQRGGRPQERCRVTWLLEFTDPELEATWLQYRATHTHLPWDAAVLAINAAANFTVLLRPHALLRLPLEGRAGLACSLALSLAHALLVHCAPGLYLRWRTALVCAARLLRALVALSACRPPSQHAAAPGDLPLQLLLLGPASASFLCAVALPLPLRPHLALQAAITATMLARVGPLCRAMPAGAEALERVALGAARHLRWLDPFDLGALPRRLVPGQASCAPVMAAVFVSYGLVLSSLAAAALDLASRTGFLRRASRLPGGAATALVRALRCVWAAGTAAALTTLPVVWEASLFADRLWSQGALGGLGVAGISAGATSLLLEAYMRLWLAVVLLVMGSACLAATGRD